jgi:hypothetical protein
MSKNTKLLNELRESLAKDFAKRLVEAVPLVSTALFDIANQTDDADMKRAILGARDAWESRSLDWEDAVRADYVKRFDEKTSGDDDKLSKTTKFSLDSLKLVEDEEMREEISLGNVSTRLKNACDYELFALTKRVEGLLDTTDLKDAQNPVLPRVFCRALLAGLTAAELNVSQRCEILLAGTAVLGDVLNETLKEANELIVSYGFMIEIPVAYGKIVNRSVSRAPLSLSTGAWQSNGGGGGTRPGGGGGSGGNAGCGTSSGGGSGGAGGGANAEMPTSLPDLFARLLARLPAVDGANPGPGVSGGSANASGGPAHAGAVPAGTNSGQASGLSPDQLLARLLTSVPSAPGPALTTGLAVPAGATPAGVGGVGGAGGAAGAPSSGGVLVALDPKLLEALERFAASTAVVGTPAALPVAAPAPAGAASTVASATPVSASSFHAAAPGTQFSLLQTQPTTAVVGEPAADALLAADADQTMPLPAVARDSLDPRYAPTEKLAAVAAAPAPVLTNLVRQAAPILAPTMQPVQTMITDVVAGVFDRIFSAPEIPDSVKALIGKLQLQIFKASMQDPQIFTNAEHPLRRFVDELADIGVKRQQSLLQGDPVYERIATIVNNLHQNFEVDPKALERANHQISAFIQAEEESAQGVIFDSVVEVQQQEELEMGDSMAAFEVDRRFAGKMFLRMIKEFVRIHWQAVLSKDYMVDGEDGEQWKADLATLDELLWSVSPKEVTKDRAKFLKLLPTLLGRLNAGLDRIGLSTEARAPYFQVMEAAHKSLLRAQKDGAGESAQDVEHQPVALAADPREKLRKRTTSIARGQWIEMTDEDGAVQRCRLSWVSPLKETFVFKNYDTKEAVTLTAEEFQLLESRSRIKLIEEHSLTERSIQGAILGMLDPADASPTANTPTGDQAAVG